ncbi:MAG: hypothetical protein QXH24_05905 [Candidatus Bathyarchaeia archaeon]
MFRGCACNIPCPNQNPFSWRQKGFDGRLKYDRPPNHISINRIVSVRCRIDMGA